MLGQHEIFSIVDILESIHTLFVPGMVINTEASHSFAYGCSKVIYTQSQFRIKLRLRVSGGLCVFRRVERRRVKVDNI